MGQEMEAPGKYWAMQFFPQESNQLPSPPSGSQSISASRGTCSAVPILLSFCSFLHKEHFLPFSFCRLILSPMWESRWRWERCGVGIPHFCSKIHGRKLHSTQVFFQLWQHDVFDWCQIMVEVRFEMKLSGFFFTSNHYWMSSKWFCGISRMWPKLNVELWLVWLFPFVFLSFLTQILSAMEFWLYLRLVRQIRLLCKAGISHVY